MFGLHFTTSMYAAVREWEKDSASYSPQLKWGAAKGDGEGRWGASNGKVEEVVKSLDWATPGGVTTVGGPTKSWEGVGTAESGGEVVGEVDVTGEAGLVVEGVSEDCA